MVKQKTRKAAAKRFSISNSGKGKIMRRRAKHGHFNVGRSKKTLMARRRDQEISGSDRKRISRLLPFQTPALP
jgi:ribosomal protein L35